MRDIIPPNRAWRYLAAAGLGFSMAWWIHRPRPVPIESAQPAAVLPSGGQVIERAPEAPVPASVKQAAGDLGGKLERAVSVTVRPKAEPSNEGAEPAAAASTPCECQPVTIDLGLVRLPDRTRRVVATSPDGEIVGGMDIPVAPAIATRSLPWAAGVSYGRLLPSATPTYGAWLERDVGRLRLGVDMFATGGQVGAVVKVGWRF